MLYNICIIIDFLCFVLPLRVIWAELSRGKGPKPKCSSSMMCTYSHPLLFYHLHHQLFLSFTACTVCVLTGGWWHPGLYQHGPHLHVQPLGHAAGGGLQRWPHRHLGFPHTRHCQNYQCTYSPSVLFMVRRVTFWPLLLLCFLCNQSIKYIAFNQIFNYAVLPLH